MNAAMGASWRDWMAPAEDVFHVASVLEGWRAPWAGRGDGEQHTALRPERRMPRAPAGG